MKKIFGMMAVLVACFGLTACNGGQKGQGSCCQKEKAACCQEGQAACDKGEAPCCHEGRPMCFDEVVATRRSIRSYDASKTISQAEVREVLAAAQEAPSWINYEPAKYYVAMSSEKMEAVKGAVGRNKDRLDGVSALIVSTFEKGKSGFVDGKIADPIGDLWGAHDCGLSVAYLILKARSMGFDTLIMGGRNADALRGIFSIPENETVMAVIALGYRKDDPQRPDRRPLDEVVKFF